MPFSEVTQKIEFLGDLSKFLRDFTTSPNSGTLPALPGESLTSIFSFDLGGAVQIGQSRLLGNGGRKTLDRHPQTLILRRLFEPTVNRIEN